MAFFTRLEKFLSKAKVMQKNKENQYEGKDKNKLIMQKQSDLEEKLRSRSSCVKNDINLCLYAIYGLLQLKIIHFMLFYYALITHLLIQTHDRPPTPCCCDF